MTATSVTIATVVDATDKHREHESLVGGTRVGRYVVLDKLGEGGMGVVYTAYDPELDRKIALKLLRHETGDDGHARLLREAQAMAKVAHPNTVAIYDVGVIDGRVFLTIELIAGVTLREWLAEKRRSWREIVAVMIEAGRGLAAAHAAGLAHRDFKPSNVMIGADGRPKVTDFGLARRAASSADDDATERDRGELRASTNDSITRVGAVIGTPAYMAPEQRKGQPPDLRTDQYSFAVTLYEALYGERPPVRDTEIEPPAKPRVFEPPADRRVPRRLAATVKRALSERPEDRYPSMEALLADLSRDPTIRLGRVIALALPIVAIAAIGSRFVGAQPATCNDAADRLRGAWDASVRVRVESSFLATKSAFAAESFERTASILDAYTADWIAMRDAACEATHGDGDTRTAMAQRMMCLDRAEAQLRALTGLLVAADTGTVERAAQAASGLPRLAECADVELLTRRHAEPSTPADGIILARATAAVAHVNALFETGRYREGLVAASAVDAEYASWLPRIAAETAYLEGQMLFARADVDQAIAAFERSSVAAERGAYPLYVARAYGRLALLWACPKHDAAAATRYDHHAQAVIAAMGGDALAETWRLTAVACLRDHESDYQGSTDAMSRALAVYTQAYGRDAVYATLLATLGSSLERDPARALRAIDEAIATQESLLGRHHPKLAYSLIVRAQQLVALGRYEEAEVASRRALSIRVPTVTRPDRLVGSAYVTLARALEARGELVAAADAARRNLEVRVAIPNGDPIDVMLAKVVAADIVVAGGHAKDAIPELEREAGELAVAAADKPDIDEPLIDARLALGRAYIGASRAPEAIVVLEQALAGATTRKDPRLVAESRFALAQARGSRELAIQARDGFAALPNPTRAAAVTRWLDGH